jgi:uncharacterized protein
MHLLVIAKEPVPGRVKTRLCPPCTPEQAAAIARAALEDTLRTLGRCPAGRRILVLHGHFPAPPGWAVLPQRGYGLAERLHAAFVDAAALAGPGPSLLVGMDTPQLTPALIADLARPLSATDSSANAVLGPANAPLGPADAARGPADAARGPADAARGPADAVLGPAVDGGWWGLALRDPTAAGALRGVPMSTPDTGRLTAAALRARGLRVVEGPVMRDVDTAADAWAVAAQCPQGTFAAAVRDHLPVPAEAFRS